MKFFNKIINRKKNSENKILLELYFALVEKYSQLQSKDSEAQALNFLNLCKIQKIRKHFLGNKVSVWICHPGIFIGKAGTDIDFLEEKTGYKFELIECEVFNNIEYELKRIGSALQNGLFFVIRN